MFRLSALSVKPGLLHLVREHRTVSYMVCYIMLLTVNIVFLYLTTSTCGAGSGRHFAGTAGGEHNPWLREKGGGGAGLSFAHDSRIPRFSCSWSFRLAQDV